MDFLVLVGTTREGRKTIRAARAIEEEFESQEHEVIFFDLKEKKIPFLGNRSYTDESPVPEDIEDLSQKMQKTDCLVIVTPEYNHSIPGALKNALDYLYPEYDDLPFVYVTDSAGGFGGVRCVSHLTDITLALGGFPGPSLQISSVSDKLGEGGEILEDGFDEKLAGFVEKAEAHVEKIR